MAVIGEHQNEEVNLRFRLAARRWYRIAKILYFCGAAFTIALALVAPLVLLFRPDLGPVLGATAGIWIFVSRLIVEPIRLEFQVKGASAQEHFDCNVLDLEWNGALVRRVSDEEVRAASGAMQDVATARDWYPAGESMPWPKSVVFCQRANALWARRQHAAYARVVVVSAAIWGAVGVIVALLDSATLGQYLVTLALPSLPALLDASEVARGHSGAAKSRQLVEDQADALLQRGSASPSEMRQIQDQLFSLRRDAPLVPEWFYNAVRTKYEADMKYAAERAGESDSRDGVDVPGGE